jgi:hypothetical protein
MDPTKTALMDVDWIQLVQNMVGWMVLVNTPSNFVGGGFLN